MMHPDALSTIEALSLSPHPEGGFYREVFRSPLELQTPRGLRAASTAIYFLLPGDAFSAFHRVSSDEAWHHYDGDPLDLHTITGDGTHAVICLGPTLALGERPQHVVPAGVWQAAVPLGGRFTLCGCTVAPGFDFADFELPARATLVALFPSLRSPIERLTRGA
jgi:predicted cupin superfamily sugar epimerase